MYRILLSLILSVHFSCAASKSKCFSSDCEGKHDDFYPGQVFQNNRLRYFSYISPMESEFKKQKYSLFFKNENTQQTRNKNLRSSNQTRKSEFSLSDIIHDVTQFAHGFPRSLLSLEKRKRKRNVFLRKTSQPKVALDAWKTKKSFAKRNKKFIFSENSFEKYKQKSFKFKKY